MKGKGAWDRSLFVHMSILIVLLWPHGVEPVAAVLSAAPTAGPRAAPPPNHLPSYPGIRHWTAKTERRAWFPRCVGGRRPGHIRGGRGGSAGTPRSGVLRAGSGASPSTLPMPTACL